MTIRYQARKKHFIDLYRQYYFKDNLTGRRLATILIVGWAVSSFLGSVFTPKSLWCIIEFLFGAGFIYTWQFIIPYFKQLKKFKPNEDKLPADVTLTIVEEGIDVEYGSDHFFCKWEDAFITAGNDKYFSFTLFHETYKGFVIPKDVFASKEEANLFLNKIYNEIVKTKRNIPVPPTVNDGRHLYKRGWLCLIPLIGAFIGFGLFILGIVKYKNIKLILIGLGGVLFTVAIYGLMFYVTMYSKAGRQNSAELAKIQLNDVMKSVEFYKLQSGTYPDSLPQILDHNNIVDIYDPIASFRNSRQFNYKKIGNKYTLFSSGVDLIPNTNDDIYPNAVFLDSSKIGLIRSGTK
ncbi:MAG TPA: hypothetical protein VK559_02780 [Ferruginibacter sp.]|nr:hypothetical protein [Ferruginibacter sp.]